MTRQSELGLDGLGRICFVEVCQGSHVADWFDEIGSGRSRCGAAVVEGPGSLRKVVVDQVRQSRLVQAQRGSVWLVSSWFGSRGS